MISIIDVVILEYQITVIPSNDKKGEKMARGRKRLSQEPRSKLDKVMLEKGARTVELAQKCGVKPQVVYAWRDGARMFADSAMIAADFLGVDVDDLVGPLEHV